MVFGPPVNINESGLTDEQEETLEHIKYNPVTNKLEANRAIRTTLNSFYLGDAYKISSGADKVYFTHLPSGIHWSSPWGGIKDQSILANQDSTGIIAPRIQILADDLTTLEPNGAPTAAGECDAIFTTNSPVSASFYANEYISMQEITPDEWIHFEVFYGPDDTGTMLFMDDRTGYSVPANGVLKLQFDHPVTVEAGEEVTVVIYRRTSLDDKTKNYLRVRTGETTVTPWRKYEIRTYISYPISHSGPGAGEWSVIGTELINNSGVNELTFNDGTRDRLTANATKTELVSPDGSNTLKVNSSTYTLGSTTNKIYQNGNSLQFISLGNTRFVIDTGNSRLYSPNMSNHIVIDNSQIKCTTGSDTRLQVNATGSWLYDERSTTPGYIALENEMFTLSDGIENRIITDSLKTYIAAPNGISHIDLRDSSYRVKDATRYRVEVNTTHTKLISPNGLNNVAISNSQTFVSGNVVTSSPTFDIMSCTSYLVNDGVRDRIESTSVYTKISSPDGLHYLKVDNTGTYVDGTLESASDKIVSPDSFKNLTVDNTTLKYYDGTKTRITSDSTGLRLEDELAAGTGGFLKLENKTLSIYDGTRERIGTSSTESHITAPNGTHNVSVTDTKSLTHDGIRDRVKVDSTETELTSPDGTKVLAITDDGVVAEDKYVYFGDASTDGSWRIRVNGTDLDFDRRASGVWNKVGGFS